jgi:mxaD protein
MRFLLALVIGLFCIGPVSAHGPTPQTHTETVEIAAPPAQVWDVVKDFAGLQRWHPGILGCKGGDNSVGAEREIAFKDGSITESLDEYNPGAMTYTYRLAKENPAALAVSFYSATLTVKPSGTGASVEWTARFYRADTGNYPPDNLNDEAAMNAMSTFLRTGLKGLKQKLEPRG